MRSLRTFAAFVITSFAFSIADEVCVLPEKNTLSSSCYGACKSSLCVNYASSTADNGSKSGTDSSFFYRGCSTASISTCKTKVTSGKCEMQCLVDTPTTWNSPHWTLTIAQPQGDKADTAVFQNIDDLTLPSTLQNLTIVGATASSQVTVPLSFSSNAFRSGTSLQQIVISDVSIGELLTNIFPESLKSLIIQRAKLTQFDPRGLHAFTSVSVLDLRENELSEIPTIIYEMRSLSALYLQSNAISNAHVTLPQLQYLQELPVFEANLTVHGSCSGGYEAVSWGDKSVCYTNGIGLDSISSSSSNEESTTSTASEEDDSSSVVFFVVLGLTLFIVLVVVGGVVLLRRWKQKTAQEQHDSFALSDSKSKSNFMGFRTLMGVSTMTQSTDFEASLNEYNTGGGLRKAVFREIPATDIATLNQLSISGPVTVSLAEHRSQLVLVTKLQTSDDDVEAALEMIPMLSQMRHPQLLSITGLVWDDRLSMTAVCEYMTLGTLEAYLRGSGSALNWANFKMKAAAEIARGLMYLHSKHTVTYDGLNGRSVFVDPKKGCKLNPVQAALPTGGSSPYSSQSYYRRCDSTNKAFFAPEIVIGEPSRPSSDMYAFGVLLAHLDTCQTADEMIRSSWRMRTHIGDFDTDNGTLLSTDGTVVSTNTTESEPGNSRRRTTQLEGLPSANSFHALHSSRSLNLEDTRRRTTPLLGAHNNDNTSFMSMFAFTPGCPVMVRELAVACLQYDPSLRPTLARDLTLIPVVGSHRDDGITPFRLRTKGHFRSSSMGVSFEYSANRNGENGEEITNPCAICLEDMEEDLAALVCGHVFHHTCVTQALVRRPACPVCREQASGQVRLYLSIKATEGRSSSNGASFHSNRGSSAETELYTNRNGPTHTVSRLSERMREMRVELDHVKEIQRMTSNHSFRLENKLVHLRQQQEQTKQQMQHIQQELDRANAKLRRSRRIATASYAQCKETKQANVEFERKVCTTADRMLEKIRERQRTCCPSCACQWTEMKHIALEFITTSGVSPCCKRHSCHVAMRDVSDRLARHHRHAQRYDT